MRRGDALAEADRLRRAALAAVVAERWPVDTLREQGVTEDDLAESPGPVYGSTRQARGKGTHD